MSDIDEQLTGLIHDWFARLRGQISAGNSEFLGGEHTLLERERILLTIGRYGEVVQKRLSECIREPASCPNPWRSWSTTGT